MYGKSIAYLLITGFLTGFLLVVSARAESAQSDTSGTSRDADPDSKIVLGWVENMRLLPQRMRSRDPRVQMPPLGTAMPDEQALALIERWINDDLKTSKETAP